MKDAKIPSPLHISELFGSTKNYRIRILDRDFSDQEK